MYSLSYYLVFICILYYTMDHSNHTMEKGVNTGSNPCTDVLTDLEYLEHMIPHHQVAIDMSKRLLLHTNHSYLMDFCRKLIIFALPHPMSRMYVSLLNLILVFKKILKEEIYFFEDNQVLLSQFRNPLIKEQQLLLLLRLI